MQQPTNNQPINPQSITTEQQQNMSKLQGTMSTEQLAVYEDLKKILNTTT